MTHLARFLVFGLVPLGLLSCGMHDDTLHCRDFCDKARACNASLTDEAWDLCLEDCREAGHSEEAVECVLSRPCDAGSFDNLVISCYLDPFAPAPD